MGIFGNLFGGAAEKEAADRNRQAYGNYKTAGQGYLNTGLDRAMGAYGDAKGQYAPLQALAAKYGKGTDMYLNALGLNGAEGNTAAQGAFKAGPQYQFNLDQGLEALNRRRAAGGMLNSGNSDVDALKFGSGLASQEYGGWLSNLSGLNNQNLQATGAISSGLAGIDAARAGTYYQHGNDLTNLEGNYTSGVANANNQEAAGKAAGAKNLLGAGLSLASLAAGGFGGGSFGGLATKATGLGGGGSSFFNKSPWSFS